MTDYFEDHCWKDVIPSDVIELYAHYRRDVFVGPRVALLAIDLYNVAYRGGAQEPYAAYIDAMKHLDLAGLKRRAEADAAPTRSARARANSWACVPAQ